jgi:glutamine synthetase
MGKIYPAPFFADQVLEKGSHACNYLLTADMELNPLRGFQLASPDRGYGDFVLQPDVSTLRRAAWKHKAALVLCDVLDTKHQPVPMAPRSLLKHVLSSHPELGFPVASELEYYLFSDSFEQAHAGRYHGLKRVGYSNGDYDLLSSARVEPYHAAARDALNASGMQIECTKGETGVGQHELNVEYNSALAMADNHVVQKQCMKEIALARGQSITFMAKPFHDDAGSSCHIHLNACDAQGRNLFAGEEDLGGGVTVSPFFRHFLGGCVVVVARGKTGRAFGLTPTHRWMLHAPEMFALYAPTVNAYKRLVRGSWAPTTATWGMDNRTTAFRVCGSGKTLRVEFRIPGADANPYLAFAAAIASGMDGVAKSIEPPPMCRGDGYEAPGLLPFPTSLGEAAARLEASNLALAAFGATTTEHLALFYRLEQRAYDAQVSDWERARYFERI